MTGDDPVQTLIARTILSEPFLLSNSVLLEAEWLLRSWYKWTRPMVADGLRLLLDLPDLQELPSSAAWAIDRYAAGADFADMIHIASAMDASRFTTFNHDIERQAGRDSPLPIETLR